MNVRAMHYDFKQKMNKADSQQNRDFRAAEIDWWLNEAQMFYLKTSVMPRTKRVFEGNQRVIDDAATLVRRGSIVPVSASYGANRYIADLSQLNPAYLFFISGEAVISCKECGVRMARLFERRHGEMHEADEFYRSSYEWGQVNFMLEENDDDCDMVLFTDGDYINSGSFSIDEVLIDYLKRPCTIYSGGYSVMGVQPGSVQDCELPEHVHSDVVDIAVMLAAGAVQSPDYQVKMQKIQFINN